NSGTAMRPKLQKSACAPKITPRTHADARDAHEDPLRSAQLCVLPSGDDRKVRPKAPTNDLRAGSRVSRQYDTYIARTNRFFGENRIGHSSIAAARRCMTGASRVHILTVRFAE